VEEKNYIPGIFNYCDRWCEKCAYTANCLLFTKESKMVTKEILKDGELADISDPMFPVQGEEDEHLETDIPGETEKSSEYDFSFQSEDEERNEDEKAFAEAGLGKPMHLLEVLADEYFDKTHTFLDELFDRYKLYGSDKSKPDNPRFGEIFSEFEVINWYHTFIGAKITRALMAKSDLDDDDDEIKEFALQDINGSAKVAAIGISKSIEALNRLFPVLEDFQPVISELLVLAGKILNYLEVEFPGYKSFIRPGLDKER